MIPIRSFLLSYVVNALWELPLLFLAGSLLARIARQARPALHFGLWTAVLGLELILPASSAFASDPITLLRQAQQWFASGHDGTPGQVTTTLGQMQPHAAFFVPSAISLPLLMAYAILTLYFLARLGLGIRQIGQVRRDARPVELSPEGKEQWRMLQARLGVRNAHLAETPRAAGIITIGFRRKLVLIQPGALDALTPEDRLAALAHECAHMRRNDFAWNLLLECLCLPIAFHPFARRTLARIAESREMVCDELAAATIAGRPQYARSLLRLAAALVPATSAPTLHAIGMLDANTLERRLMRLKSNSSSLRKPQILAMTATAALVLSGTWATASALHVGVGASAAQTKEPSKAVLHVESGTMAGQVQARVNPIYPQAAKDAGVTGTVVLKAVIDEDGVIQQLSVVSGPKELQESAIDAVRQWTYQPYLLNGQPVSVETTININYQLN